MKSNANDERIKNNKQKTYLTTPSVYWILGCTSLPMIGGAYIGFQREMKKQAKVIPNQQTVNGALLASKALGIGTLLSVGGFGILSAGTYIIIIPSIDIKNYNFLRFLSENNIMLRNYTVRYRTDFFISSFFLFNIIFIIFDMMTFLNIF